MLLSPLLLYLVLRYLGRRYLRLLTRKLAADLAAYAFVIVTAFWLAKGSESFMLVFAGGVMLYIGLVPLMAQRDPEFGSALGLQVEGILRWPTRQPSRRTPRPAPPDADEP